MRTTSTSTSTSRDQALAIILSQDTLVSNILSHLKLKEAVATSILSRRWRYAWCSLKKLDFFVPTTSGDQQQQTTRYIAQVTSVLRGLRCSRLESLRIGFSLDNTHSRFVDEWIRIAHAKRVQVFELNFYETGLKAWKDGNTNHHYYAFPLPSSDGDMVHLSLSTSLPVDTMYFKEISLVCVDVCETTFNLILKNSPYLETLYIFGGSLLTNVVLDGKDTKMKRLVLLGSREIQTISLHDSNLELFHFSGVDATITFTNLPNLKDIDVGRVSLGKNNKVFKPITSIALYLEVLSLDVDRELEDIEVEKIPQLPNVKNLILTLPSEENDSILPFIDIAKKCPKLETFEVSLHWCATITKNKPTTPQVMYHEFSKLKHLEIVGFRYKKNDIEFFLYMMANAVGSLKSVVLDTSIHVNDECDAEEREGEIKNIMENAKQHLEICVPSSATFVIC